MPLMIAVLTCMYHLIPQYIVASDRVARGEGAGLYTVQVKTMQPLKQASYCPDFDSQWSHDYGKCHIHVAMLIRVGF